MGRPAWLGTRPHAVAGTSSGCGVLPISDEDPVAVDGKPPPPPPPPPQQNHMMGAFELCALLLLVSSPSALLCVSGDTLLPRQSLRLNQTVVSAGKTFALGFFAPRANSSRHYLGIWYNNIPGPRTVVWVANRESPFKEPTVALRFSDVSDQLVVSDAAGQVLWSTNITGAVPGGGRGNLSAMLQDSGNFVVMRDRDTVWESFHSPTDTILPYMTLWVRKKLHDANRIVSWKDVDDPSPGDFSFGIDPVRTVQMIMWKGTRKYRRNGIWDASLTRGGPLTTNGYASSFTIHRNDDMSNLSLTSSGPNLLQRMVLEYTGSLRLYFWNSSASNWTSLPWFGEPKPCDSYGVCGPYGVCQNTDSSQLSCSCLEGYAPRSQTEWESGNYSGGCVGQQVETCHGEGVFRKRSNVEVPDMMTYLTEVTDADSCVASCRNNCSCRGYSFVSNQQAYNNLSIARCLIWVEDMIDMIQYTVGGEDFFLRQPASGTDGASGGKNKKLVLLVTLPLALLAVVLCVASCWCWRKRAWMKGRWKNRTKTAGTSVSNSNDHAQWDFSGSRDLLGGDEKEGQEMDLPVISFEVIAAATDNFSDANKLGQGGFGDVYRGVILPSGEKVAVKRLSRNSGQGLDEFKTELVLIAKLQHRNLVRLLGCCIQGEEKLLIYEYMPNKSLDYFLFDPTRRLMLDWSKRFDIIDGVARGLLYLHRDSRLRVVHRDLKPSNILLDEEMNPKISDFGMARIFGGNQNADSTNRVVGTFGYMSPEYAMEGLFSVKSDVYSFGVLMLEIVSGKRNIRSGLMTANLLRRAWELWTAGRAEEIIDDCIRGSGDSTEQVLRCIHIGLLCVQDHAHERPTMSSVVIMLCSDATINQVPRQPTFTLDNCAGEMEYSSQLGQDGDASSVDVSITILDGR